MTTIPLTRSKHVLPFAAVMRQQGESVERLLQQAGLPQTCLQAPESLIPVGAVSAFRDLCERRSGLHDIALAAATPLRFASLGADAQPLLQAPTLRRALDGFRTLVESQSSNLVVELHPQSCGGLLFTHRVLTEVVPGEWHRALYTLAWMLKAIRLADSAFAPSEIWIDAKAARERAEVIESLGAAPRFGQPCSGFLIPAELLALPVTEQPAKDGERFSVPSQRPSARPPASYAEALKAMLRVYAADGWLSIEAASEVADTSVRTMQRRLSGEQTSFSRVLEETRAELAGELLETTSAAINAIARQLGYKNQGDFTRAFRRWSGVSPSQYREQRARS